jgi:hypothetical protein
MTLILYSYAFMSSNFNDDRSFPLFSLSLFIIILMQSRNENMYTKVDPVQMSMGALRITSMQNDTRRLFD